MKKKNPYHALIFSIIPGAGQLYNGDYYKAAAFAIANIFFIFEMAIFGAGALVDFITLGSVPIEHNSLFMMIKGAMQIIICGIFLIVTAISMIDAKKTAMRINSGYIPVKSLVRVATLVKEKGFAYIFTVPAYILMIVAIVFPVLVTICMAFTNYGFKNMPPIKLLDWVGMENFKSIFIFSSYRNTFMKVFTWNIIWTFAASTLQISLGILMAILSNQKFIRLRRFYGSIFLLPWAVPSFIMIMTFSNIFNDSAGAINTQLLQLINRLPFIDIGMIPWKTEPFWTKTALIGVQTWIGFPYIFMLTTSILQSIPIDVQEAATIDGVNAFKRFRYITFPAIMTIAAPVLITQYTGNFNNFSVIYLFNNGGPGSLGNNAGTTDILISWVYKMSTGGSPQYSIVAAVLLIISSIVVAVSLIVFKKTNAFRMED